MQKPPPTDHKPLLPFEDEVLRRMLSTPPKPHKASKAAPKLAAKKAAKEQK